MAWSIGKYSTINNLDEETSATVYHSQGMVHLIKVSFASSGKAVFYTSGSKNDKGDALDTKGYLSESYQPLDADAGVPEDYTVVDDESGTGSNFLIECDVESGNPYYLYVRHYKESDSGDIEITIVPPESEDEEYYEPDFSNTKIVVNVDGTDVDIKLDGLDPDYEDVWKVKWDVWEYGSDNYILEDVYLRSDGYDLNWSFDRITLGADDGIKPNTKYAVYVIIFPYPDTDAGEAGNTHIVSRLFTTGSGDNFGAYIEFGSNTGTTITVSVKGLDTSYGRNDRYIYWSIDGVEKSRVSLSSGVSQSNSYTFTGLSPSTSYTIGARITYTSNGSPLSKELKDISCSTANWASEQQSGLGTISSTKTTNWTLRKATIFYASVKFSQSGSVTISSSGSYDTYGYLTTGTPAFDNSSGVPNNYVADNDDDGDVSNFSLTYAVEAGVTYYIWVRGYSASTSVGTITLNVSFSNRPAKFQWADGTTKKMPRQEFDITADEWCDLLDNINAVREYKGYSKFPQGSYTGTSYNKYFTYPASGQPFRYQHYNQALNAITEMLGAGYNANAVKKGDPVTAAKINLLVEWLNGIT